MQISGQYRCESNGTTDSSQLSGGPAPVLGDGPANATSSLSSASTAAAANATLFNNGTTTASSTPAPTTSHSGTGVPGVPGVQITSSTSKSSAGTAFHSISDLTFLVHIAGGIFLGAIVLVFQ